MYNTIRALSPEGDGAAAANAHIGAHLKMRRKHMNLTQAQVAEEMGITQGAYQKIEAGSSALTVPRLAQACFALVAASSQDRLGHVENAPARLRSRDARGLKELSWVLADVLHVQHESCEARNPGGL